MASLTEVWSPMLTPALSARLNTEYNRNFSPVKAPNVKQDATGAAVSPANIPSSLADTTVSEQGVATAKAPPAYRLPGSYSNVPSPSDNQALSGPSSVDWAASRAPPSLVNQPSRAEQTMAPRQLYQPTEAIQQQQYPARLSDGVLPTDIELIIQRRVKEELAKREVSRVEKFTGMPPAVIQSLLLVATGVFIIVALDIILAIVTALMKR
jgi:hypothetical protein